MPLIYVKPYKVAVPTYTYPNVSHMIVFDGTNGTTGPFNNYGSSGSKVEISSGTPYIRSTPARTTGNTVGDFRTGNIIIAKNTRSHLGYW